MRGGDFDVEWGDFERARMTRPVRDDVIDAFSVAVDERRGKRARNALHEVGEDDRERALFLIARAIHHSSFTVAFAMSAFAAGSTLTECVCRRSAMSAV